MVTSWPKLSLWVPTSVGNELHLRLGSGASGDRASCFGVDTKMLDQIERLPLLYRKSRKHSAESELLGIERLHQADIAATLASDAKQLAALWDGDGLLLGQDESRSLGGKPIQGPVEAPQTTTVPQLAQKP
jgi:hypothetical protein